MANILNKQFVGLIPRSSLRDYNQIIKLTVKIPKNIALKSGGIIKNPEYTVLHTPDFMNENRFNYL